MFCSQAVSPDLLRGYSSSRYTQLKTAPEQRPTARLPNTYQTTNILTHNIPSKHDHDAVFQSSSERRYRRRVVSIVTFQHPLWVCWRADATGARMGLWGRLHNRVFMS